jgi:hypothetical protein
VSTLSNADTIQPRDKFTRVKVTLYIEVNVSAYRREYGEGSNDLYFGVTDIKDDVRQAVLGQLTDGPNDLFPEGILHEVELA